MAPGLTLAELIVKQYDLQVESFGIDPLKLEGEERLEYIRWNVLALEDELHELLQTTGWKPWASSNHVNEDEALGELTDCVHFWANLVLVSAPRGSHPVDVGIAAERRYLKKREVNAERQATGYTGVDGKCVDCHRDLAEVDLIRLTEDEVIKFACVCGRVLT